MGLADRVSALARVGEQRYSADLYYAQYVQPTTFGYGGVQYSAGLGVSSLFGNRASEISSTLPAYAAALRGCPPAFAAQMVRALVLSQAKFCFRNKSWTKNPGRKFGTTALGPLERPWPNATTGELLSRMEWSAGLDGNAFVVRRPDRLKVLRPDWVAIVYGSEQEPDDAAHALDGELIGYVYRNGGIFGGRGQLQTLLPQDVAHWSPLPDPEAAGLGMSWLTPALRDIQSDQAATEHKLMFWSNGATPHLVINGITAPDGRTLTAAQFSDIVSALDAQHTGISNAYKTLYLTAGANATVVGSNFRDMDLKAIQGASETRISALSRVPAALLGISEGLAGSSLNAGNFGMARRIFADTWVYPMLEDLSAALAKLVRVPADADLWFDTSDIPLLREDGKDAAEIASTCAAAIRQLVDGGFVPDTAVTAVRPEWAGMLQHTGKLSVQLQEPGAAPQPAAGPEPVEA